MPDDVVPAGTQRPAQATASAAWLRAISRRDRAVALAAVATVTVSAWAYVLAGAGTGMPALDMSGLPTAAGAMAGMEPVAWTVGYALLMLAMWWLMMVAMMLPSATPAILLFVAVSAQRAPGGRPIVGASVFALGYLTIWAGFSVAAVLSQFALQSAALLSPEMVATSLAVGAALLIAAGVWQMTPFKEACLRKCRSPLRFLAEHWREGTAGAWRMGMAHGAYCLGCCWVLMLLLFYGGVMNLYWIAGLSAFVLVEKTAGSGVWLGRLAGLALLGWGGAIAVGLLSKL